MEDGLSPRFFSKILFFGIYESKTDDGGGENIRLGQKEAGCREYFQDTASAQKIKQLLLQPFLLRLTEAERQCMAMKTARNTVALNRLVGSKTDDALCYQLSLSHE